MAERWLCRHLTEGHTAILDLDASAGVLLVPSRERNWVVSREIRTTVVGGLPFRTLVAHRRYDRGSREMSQWLQTKGWRFAANDAAAGLPLEAGFTDDGSMVFQLVPERTPGDVQDGPAQCRVSSKRHA
ncbi:hypothetical protein [Flexivirga caeni]|uniref:Uncharacterized protein n=1 Tax=Flexivirga caeni TaxID=2294115 RepID=A0A3M9MFW1_9MICO|nr:hypothetical protein [Flexivirga caeni]RNI24384.1 hypothetical protein EFY87_05340 [Flexivirga caeni]